MTIKGFKVRPKVSVSYEEETVNTLMAAVEDIFAKRGGQCSLEELYRCCHSLCSVGRGQLVYERLHAVCDGHIAAMVDAVAATVSGDGEGLLTAVRALWDSFKSEMAALRQVFLMLDRGYIRHSTSAKSLWAMGLGLLRRHILENKRDRDIAGRITLCVVERVDGERDGEETDGALLAAVMVMAAHLNIYKNCVEPALLSAATAYYERLGHRLMAQLTVPNYVEAVMARLDDEHRRCSEYLDTTTAHKLAQIVEREMVEGHHAAILDKGFDAMADDERCRATLRHFYALSEAVHRVDAVEEHFGRYSTERGMAIVAEKGDAKDRGDGKEVVEQLLALKLRLDALIALSFKKHANFRKIIRKSWEHFLNRPRSKTPAELMAKFVDHQLQRGGRGISEQQLEDTLDGVMDILRFVEAKDVFQAFYKKDLAKRLLLGTSSSSEAEKGMILRIRKECGAKVAHNLENMFKDIAISKDLASKFEAEMAAKAGGSDPAAIEYDVRILTSGCWPTYNTDPVALPKVVEQRLAAFSRFYVAANSGRKLLWTAPLSHCLVAANFPRGRKELVLSALQATVLLLFNHRNKMAFGDIAKATKIKKEQLQRTMLSLVAASILLKRTRGTECGDGEEFKLNAKYESRLRRVKVNQIQIVETKQERSKTTTKIHKDRQYQIDAAVVRIMKSRKTLIHQQLMAQCLEQLRFDANPRAIKKRIQSLIESDYLERDATNSSVYHYKA